LADDVVNELQNLGRRLEDIDSLLREYASGGTSFGSSSDVQRVGSRSSSSRRSAFTDDEDEDADSFTSAMTTSSKKTQIIAESLEKASKMFDSIAKSAGFADADSAKIKENLIEAGKGINAAFGMIKDNFSTIFSEGIKTALENEETKQAALMTIRSMALFPLAKSLAGNALVPFQEIQKKLGGTLADIDSDVNRYAKGANKAMTDFFDVAAGKTSDAFKIGGVNLGVLLQDSVQSYRNIVEPLMNETKTGFFLAQEAAKGSAKNMTAEMIVAAEALGLKSSEIGTFISRNIDKTGKANTDFLKSSVAAADAAAKTLSVSPKVIMPVMEEIAKSVDRFGNASVTSMAKMAAQVTALGIDFSNLNQVVGTFQGFESAASNVGKLTAAFGVNLDAMELMEMANEDQASMIETLRASFEEAGVDVANLSLAQKRLISDALGGVGVDKVERMLGPLGEGLEELNEKTQKSAEESLVDASKGFADAVKDLTDVITSPFDKFQRAFDADVLAEFGQKGSAALGKLNTEANQGVKDLYENMQKVATAPLKATADMLKEAVEIPIAGASFNAEALGKKLAEIAETLNTKIGGAKAVVSALVDAAKEGEAARAAAPAPAPALPAATAPPATAPSTTPTTPAAPVPAAAAPGATPEPRQIVVKIELTGEASEMFKTRVNVDTAPLAP
jgi:hypothetical protein